MREIKPEIIKLFQKLATESRPLDSIIQIVDAAFTDDNALQYSKFLFELDKDRIETANTLLMFYFNLYGMRNGVEVKSLVLTTSNALTIVYELQDLFDFIKTDFNAAAKVMVNKNPKLYTQFKVEDFESEMEFNFCLIYFRDLDNVFTEILPMENHSRQKVKAPPTVSKPKVIETPKVIIESEIDEFL